MWRWRPSAVRHHICARSSRVSAIQTRSRASALSCAGVPSNAALAVAQDDHALAQRGDVVGLVGETSTIRASPSSETSSRKRMPLLGVKRGGRLVEHEQLRVAEQCLRERDAPAHAARQLADAVSARRPQVDQLEHTAHLAVACARVGHLLEDRDVVDELERRELAVKARLLGHVAELAAHRGALLGVGGIRPSRRRRPPSGASTVASIRMSVVLPAPLGPAAR